MKLFNTFEVPSRPDETWNTLLDVPRIVSCVPGAELTSQQDNGTYAGRIAVKLGPVALKFNGTVTFAEIDPQTHTATVNAKGSDQQGRGNAGATTIMKVTQSSTGSTVVLETDLLLSGMVAQYGRASGIIVAVSNEITEQFATALRKKIIDEGAGQPLAEHVAPDMAAPHAEAAPKSLSLFSILWRIFLTRIGLRRRPS